MIDAVKEIGEIRLSNDQISKECGVFILNITQRTNGLRCQHPKRDCLINSIPDLLFADDMDFEDFEDFEEQTPFF